MEKKGWGSVLGLALLLQAGNLPLAQAQTEDAADPLATGADPLSTAAVPVAASAPETDAASGDTAGSDGDRKIQSRMVEEIVVTAQKREENLQAVPSSVQAFSAGMLDAMGVSDIKDMGQITPGLQYDSMASYSIIFIRGVGGDAFQAGIDSSVATYMDGLYLPFTFSSAQALGDVKQVEVLKGPQGTLYGRNAIAGAIKVELKGPNMDEWGGEVMQQFGNFKDTKSRVSVSGPVPFTNNTLAVGASGLYQQHQSHSQYYLDKGNKDYYQPYRNAGQRYVAKWVPNDVFDAQIAHYDMKQQDADSVITVLVKPSPAFTPALTGIDEDHVSGNKSNQAVNATTRITTLTANARLVPWFDNKLVYGHIKARSTIIFDYDSAPEPVLDISAIPNTAKSDLGELLFSSNPANTPDWLEWIGGIYYEDTTKTGRYPIKVNALDASIGTGLTRFSTLVPFLPQSCAEYAAILGVPGLECDSNSDTNLNPYVEVSPISGITTKALSSYVQFTLHVSEATSVVLGGRISNEDRSLDYAGYTQRIALPSGNPANLTGEDIITPELNVVKFQKQSHTSRSFTPNFGLNYKFNEDILGYYRYSEAFKSGNYNGLNITDPPDRIEPEQAAGHEFGLKTELFDRRLKLNTALFSTKVTNAQTQVLSFTSGGVTSLQNAATYTVKGVEVESSWFATDALVFSLSAVYLDGEYGSFLGRAFRPETGFSDESIDFSGNKTVRTPKYSGTAAVSYTFPLMGSLEGEVGADIYYNDGFFYDALNTLTQDAYQLVGARAGVYYPDWRLRLTVYGKNLTDDIYYTQSYRQDFGDTVFYGPDRTYGAYVTWNF